MEVDSTTNSEENSQMDETDPILPLAVPSSPKTPIGIPKSRGRPPKFSPRARGAAGALQAIGVSARKVSKVMAIVAKVPPEEIQTCSIESAEVSLIELAHNMLTFRCQQLSTSQDLFMMIDGSGTTKLQRSFFAIHFGGYYGDQKWSSLFGLFELVEKGAQIDIKAIQAMLSTVQEIQRQKGYCITNLYDFKSITFDNCSENTGRKAGVGVLLQDLHKHAFDIDPRAKAVQLTYKPLILKGCSDHIVNLVSRDIESAIVAELKRQKKMHLVQSDQCLATTVLINLYSKVIFNINFLN